jgi:hypothetical protein
MQQIYCSFSSLCVRALISGGLATFANKQESICAIKRSSTAIEFELSCGPIMMGQWLTNLILCA